MQIHRVSYGVRGFARLVNSALRWAYMLTDKAKYKLKVLAFWQKHGLTTTLDAFNIKERTLYNWKAALKQGDGRAEALNEKSRRPKRIREREWPNKVKEEIRRLRAEHPNLGKDKVHCFLKPFCLQPGLVCPSVSTIGNLIRDMGGLRVRPEKVRHNGTIVARKRTKRARKPKQFTATHPGHCAAFDTIEKHLNGLRRYVLTFTDVYSRFSLAWATNSHASQAASEFFALVRFLFPFQFDYILTDNGSEFAKHFDTAIREEHLTHWRTYPKCPKMNPHVERFNRTIQEEYVDYHEPKLANPNTFNYGLMKYLLWYNTERPHFGINLQTPVNFITSNHPQDCNMYLTNTAV